MRRHNTWILVQESHILYISIDMYVQKDYERSDGYTTLTCYCNDKDDWQKRNQWDDRELQVQYLPKNYVKTVHMEPQLIPPKPLWVKSNYGWWTSWWDESSVGMWRTTFNEQSCTVWSKKNLCWNLVTV